jgi:hypothetical protein
MAATRAGTRAVPRLTLVVERPDGRRRNRDLVELAALRQRVAGELELEVGRP